MNSLIGIWFYVSLIYQGQPIQKPNPELKMSYIFYSNQVNEILYYRENENGYCKRKAEYEIQNNQMVQKVIEVDSGNASFCGQDTDMQLGNVSYVKFRVEDNRLYLELPLGDETLTYVWEKSVTN